ncbi:vacuolar glutathione S-conjugate transporter [Talaromyces pinophilus]|uniref:Vacuolar glutathione S-conjugate transporter n=1 Tax=Talaromyces pinophilus TaxID=128442 RepID=A0A6V8HBQ2_TALPI|nr:vacuolar glutathione S-conjugate transporter [Talaromyces pinophilus]
MIRGGLVTLVYDATLKLHSSKATDAAAVTHMSTDIDQITQGMTNFDVLWAAPIEVGLAIYILWREIGLACLAPVGIAVGCTLAAFLLGKLSRKAQRVWVNAVQLRTTATVSMLNNIKGIRMSGLSSRFSTNIQDLRVKELAASKSYRHLTVLKNTIGTLPQVMGPVTAFVIYVLVRQNSNSRLDPATAFTSLSLITLLSSPIFLFMFALPPFTASIACYDRIQKYLLSADDETNGSSLGDIKKSDGVPSTNYPDTESNMMELKTKHSMQDEGNDLVILDRASFSFENQGPAVLHDISFSIQKGNLVMLTGAVGSGKSTLLLAILGECFQVGGTLRRSPILRIGYCGQTPWLRNLSVRQIIQGASPFDKDCNRQSRNQSKRRPETATGLARALYAKKHLLLLDDITSGLDATTVQILTQRVFGPDGLCRRHHMSVLLATHDVRLMYFMDSIMALSPEGRIIHRGPPSIVNSGDEVCSSPQSENDSLHKTSEPEQSSNREKDAALADLARKVGDWRLYLYYFNTMGWALTAIFIMVSIAFTFCYNFPTIWLQLWSESESSHPGEHQVMYLVVYAVLGILAIILMSASVWVLIVEMVPRSSIKLHKMLLDTVLSAPFSFFISTDTGVTLNRFSQDMSLIDMQLPFGFLQAVDGVFECIAAAVLIAVSSYWTALSFPVLILILYVLQKFYLSTSRQMRFLDLEAKSPLYSHFLDTLHGLVTIRAFAWHSEFQETNQKLLNDSQKPYYLMFSIQRWLNLVLDLVVTAIAVTIVAIASQVHGLSSAGALGVALSNIVSFSRILTYLIQAWTQMETSIGAISRLKSFTEETSSEHLPEEVIVPKGFWPSRGAIQFSSLTSGYGGKSSLILSILRMTDIHGGTITIDGIDLATLSRESVREKLNVMPQDAMILSGSVRFNIDPSGKKSDEEILSTLAEVGLLDLIESRGGLSSTLDASALSSGQQQLICLTRALINPSRILILDEATSNVDQETETKMVKLIQDRFRGCTVVAVAHRLRTIRDFDVILVLDQGRVLEYGRPDDLLQIPGSRFRELWESQR